MDKHWIPEGVIRSLMETAVEHACEEEPLSEDFAPYHIGLDLVDSTERSKADYAKLWGWPVAEVERKWPDLIMRASTWEAAKVHRDQLK